MITCYCVLTVFFGEKGIYRQRALQEQINDMKKHVADLQTIDRNLSDEVLNLSYDYDTIKVAANRLGYVSENQQTIKLCDFNMTSYKSYDPGQHLVLPEISFVSDTAIKTLSASLGIIVIMIELIIEYRRQAKKDNAK